MRILIIGASGQVGRVFYDLYKGRPDTEVLGTYNSRPAEGMAALDITDINSVSAVFEKFKPDTVILSSALTAVDFCETNPDEAMRVNAEGTRNVISVCGAYKARPVYLSTEYVFDGQNGPYTEDAEPNPINVYGRSKLAGEKYVLGCPFKPLVVRSTVIYHYDRTSLNFVMQLITRLPASQRMRVPTDQISNPTYAPDLVLAVDELINKNCIGIYNVVGSDRLSRYDFAFKACMVLGLDKRFVDGVDTPSLAQAAPRPLSAGLVTAKLTRDTGYKPMSAAMGLSKFYTEWQRDSKK